MDNSKGIDAKKSRRSKECMLCYCYFVDTDYRYEREVCNGCHYISMMVYELRDIATLNIKDVDYQSIIWNMNRSDAINRLNNSKLVVKGSL